jgi:hypothetical protein
MVDLLPHVAELLAPTKAQIELAWQDTTTTLPLIVLSMPTNTATTSDGAEIWSDITIQVDAFDADKLSLITLVKGIDDIMTPAGFTRSIAQPFTENGLERYMMQYRAGVNFSHTDIIL